MSFDRGYISHHLVTDQEAMQAELANPYIVLTDLKLTTPGADRHGARASPRRTAGR